MPLIPKPNYNQIFASQAPEQDKPAVFNNYPEGWGLESRPNNGKPTIKGFNYLQQTSDLKDLWILQNGACLPYDESIEYADGAPVLKDGVIQYKTAGGFKSRDAVTIPTYNSAADGVGPVTGVAEGAYFNVRSTDDDTMLVEYQNVGGSAVATGKSYLSALGVENQEKPASTIKDASGKDQQEINDSRINRFPSVLDNPNVVGDGVADDTLAIQEYLTDTDVNLKSSVYFPFRNFDYLIQSHLILQEPVMIYGDKGATYNRGDGKKGNILIGASADYAFNLGNERIRDHSTDWQDIPNHISRNAADNWSVKNIGITTAGGAAYVKTGIKHTAAHNGPDRGFLLREVSGNRLKHVLHVTDQGQSVQLGTLVIENCCLSNNDIPIFAEGLVFGLRFVGNQCEQNYRGCIHGSFTAGVTIEDNMLEHTPDPIKLTIPPAGAKFQASIKRNYFEANTGEALIEVASSNDDTFLETGPNFFSRASTFFPNHYLLLKGKLDAPRRATVSFTVINRDPYPVSLYETATIKMDSDIFSKVNFFRQADGYSAGGVGGRVFTSKLNTFASRSTAKSGNVYGPTYPNELTELGNIRYSDITASPLMRPVPLAANTGDVLALNILFKLSPDAEGNIRIVVGGGASGVVTELLVRIDKEYIGHHGGIIMLTTVAKSLIDVSSMRIGLESQLTAGSGKFYGASIENFGQHAVGEGKDIYPSVPGVTYSTNTAQLTYDPPTLGADESTTRDVILPGVAVGAVVQAAFSQYDPNIEISAAVSVDAIVTVKFKNTGSTSVNLVEGVLTVKSL